MESQADRAADYADRRARDTDRIGRWTVGIALALAAAQLGALGALAFQVAALAAAVERLAP